MHCINCGKETPRGNRICIPCANRALGNAFKEKIEPRTNEEGEEVEYQLASIGRRFIALLIDSLILMMIGVLSFLIILTFNVDFKDNLGFFNQIERFFEFTYPRIEKKFNLQVTLLCYAIILPYIALVIYFFGVTPGKVCMGLVIIHEKTMAPVTFLRGMFRELICRYFASYIMLLIGLLLTIISANSVALVLFSSLISLVLWVLTALASLLQYIIPFFNVRKKTLHDYFAGTIVVKL